MYLYKTPRTKRGKKPPFLTKIIKDKLIKPLIFVHNEKMLQSAKKTKHQQHAKPGEKSDLKNGLYLPYTTDTD